MQIYKKWLSVAIVFILSLSLLSPAAVMAEEQGSELNGQLDEQITVEENNPSTETTTNDSAQVEVKTNKQALVAAIEEAEQNMASVKVSVDGTDIDPTEYWVTQAELDAYAKAITAAQELVADETATQDAVNAKTLALNQPTEAFNQAKKAGTKSEVTTEQAYQTVSNYMISKVTNPKFGDEWFIISLARGGATVPSDYYDTYYKNVVEHVKSVKGELHKRKYTEYSRLIIALTAVGKDPRDVGGYNLVEKLSNFDNVVWQGVNGAYYGLIALDTWNFELPETATTTKQGLVDYILSKQVADGGFALSGSKADPDMTGMAIQALAPYKNQSAVSEAIERALAVLASLQKENGGYQSWGTENVESATQVAAGLISLGIDPKSDARFDKVLPNIMTYYSESDGGFKHVLKETSANGMATEQVGYTLAAYHRLLNGQTALYDMSDTKLDEIKLDTTKLQAAIEEAENNKASVKVSVDGTDIDPVENWVTQAELDVYAAAIIDAQNLVADETAMQEAVEAKTLALNQATEAFNHAKKAGIKSEVTTEQAYQTVGQYMLEKVPNPKFSNEWFIISLARGNAAVPSDYYDTYYKNVVEYVVSKNGELAQGNYTEYSRLIIALTAIGKDPTNVGGYNLVEKLADFDKVTWQGVNGAVFALIALGTWDFDLSNSAMTAKQSAKLTTKENLIDFILEKQLTDNGWAFFGTKADPDMTAMAIQSLAPYYNSHPKVKVAVDHALTTLATMQKENGGYATWGTENVESAAQVVTALASLGIDANADPRFNKVIANIMTYYSPVDGGFKHVLTQKKADGMATEQVGYTLAAHHRVLKGQPALYDMSDTKSGEIEKPEEPKPEKPKPEEPKPEKPNEIYGNASYSIVISSSEVPLTTTNIEFYKGETVFDVLKRATERHGIALSYRETEYGTYIDGIADLYEFDRGPLSGWMYRVNGVFPEFSAAFYTLKPGNRVEWLYTVDLGEDIGGGFDDTETEPETDSKLDTTKLQAAIEEAEQNKASVKVSVDGKEIESTENWVTQADLDAYTTAIKSAQDLIADTAAIQDDVNAKTLALNQSTEAFNKAKKAGTKSTITTPTEQAYNTVGQYMLEKAPNPKFGSEWFIISLARGGATVPSDYYDTYYKNVVEHVKSVKGELHKRKYTEYSRLIIALTAIGKDPRDVGGYNLVEKLSNFADVTWQGVNGAYYGLIALDTWNFELSETATTTKQGLVDHILSKQLADGGFALSGTKADPDMTGMAIQALAPYKNQPAVSQAIERALTTLANIQLPNGGYQSWGTENVESATQVVAGLISLGIDPEKDSRFNKVLPNIMTYYNESDGGFKHVLKETSANGMATEQVGYTLAAYQRLLNGQTALYDMSDTKSGETENPEEPKPEEPKPEEPKPEEPKPEEPKPEEPKPEEPGGIYGYSSYSIVISSSEIPLTTTNIEFYEGETVFDVLKRATELHGIALSYRDSQYGIYVEGIDDLYEFDRGPLSGWMYRVNGIFPSFSAALYTLQPGDRVEWLYTLDLGKDVGGYVDGVENGEAPGEEIKPECKEGATDCKEETDKKEDKEKDKNQENNNNPEPEITVEEGDNKAVITAGDLAKYLANDVPKLVIEIGNQNIEIPTSSLKGIKLEDDEQVVATIATNPNNHEFTVDFGIQAAEGTLTPIPLGKDYLKVTLPADDVTPNTVVLQLVEGEYKPVPHTIINGKIVLFTKTGGTFITTEKQVTFKDIEKLANKDEIEFLASRFIIQGVTEESFEPNKAITRAQFAALISRSLGLQATGTNPFADTEGKWYAEDVQALFEAGITRGTTASTFNPEAPITRQQASAFIARLLEYLNVESQETGETDFKDVQNISTEYLPYIELLNSLNIMTGKQDGSFDPAANLTRAQTAKILKRALNLAGMM